MRASACAVPCRGAFLLLGGTLTACGGGVEATAPADGGADVAGASYTGYVSASSSSNDYYAISASFIVPDASLDPQRFSTLLAPSSSCPSTDVAVGACCYSAGAQVAATRFYASAGVITVNVNGGSTLASMQPFPPDPKSPSYYQYYSPPTGSPRWTPGDVLVVSASGDAVHAFAGSLHTVRPLLGVAPALTAPVIDRSRDFQINWTPDSQPGEEVSFALELSGGGRITCTAGDALGKVTVPSRLLANAGAMDSANVLLERALSSGLASDSDNATVFLEALTFLSGQATFK